MQIFIDGQNAVLKPSTSFDYVSENRMFSGADDYTLAITFPLKDCPENIAIFGHVDRKDVEARALRFGCEIRSAGFSKNGTLTITEISDTDIKAQFLFGRSEQNFNDAFVNSYINNLHLGSPAVLDANSITPEQAWSPEARQFESVALPWVCQNLANIQNKVSWNEAMNKFSWYAPVFRLSWQPYLLYIAERICDAVGYTCDFSKWKQHPYLKYLLICNCLPAEYRLPNYASALPHWTVEEFFQKLEPLLRGEFDIDHYKKHITFSFTSDILAARGSVAIDAVVDQFSSTIKANDVSCDYQETKNYLFKDADHDMWPYYSCDWFIRDMQPPVAYETLDALLADNKDYRQYVPPAALYDNRSRLLYASDVDTYFIIKVVDINEPYYVCDVQPLNLYGGLYVNEDRDSDASSVEIELVPVCIAYSHELNGYAIHLKTQEGSDSSFDASGSLGDGKTVAQRILEAGTHESTTEYYNTIYLAYWDGVQRDPQRSPYPYVSNVVINKDWTGYEKVPYSFRVNDGRDVNKVIYEIDSRIKYTFKFLADSIPDVRAVFHIRGRRYLCEKITATFTENGMSQLLKGEFYPIVED